MGPTLSHAAQVLPLGISAVHKQLLNAVLMRAEVSINLFLGHVSCMWEW